MAGNFRDLLIRLGLDDKEFVAKFNKVERQLVSFSNNARDLGKTLSTNLTLPLGLAAGAAVKTFADFDRLEKGLDVFADTSTSGAEELEKLLDVVRDARTTLDLKSAASASLQLQAVGISADRARETIKQLGIAATVSGSQAEDIGEITRQFAQALSVGRVLEQDLRIIKSRIPAIGKVLQEEFGTVTAEGLREANISADEFVDRLTRAIASNEQFQNVQISLAKAIETFGINTQIAASKLGQLISETLDLPNLLNNITNQIDRLTNFFTSLSEQQRKSIVNFGLLLAAIGPVVYTVGTLAKGIRILYRGMIALGLTSLNVIKYFKTLNRALVILTTTTRITTRAMVAFNVIASQLLLPLIAIVGAVTLGKAAYDNFKNSVAQANRALDAINKANEEAKLRHNEARDSIAEYITVLESSTTSINDKILALAELNRITNNQFTSVRILESGVEGLKEAQDSYFKSLENVEKLRILSQAQQKLKEDIEQTKLSMESATVTTENFKTGLQFGAVAGSTFTKSLQGLGKKTNNDLKILEDNLKKINEQIEVLGKQKAVEKFKKDAEELAKSVEEVYRNLSESLNTKESLGSILVVDNIDTVKAQIKDVEKAITDAFSNKELRKTNVIQKLQVILEDLNKKLKELEAREKIVRIFEDLDAEITTLEKIRDILGEDTTENIKKQIEAVGSSLEKAIEAGASKKTINKLKQRLDGLRESLKPLYLKDPTVIDNLLVSFNNLKKPTLEVVSNANQLDFEYKNVNGTLVKVAKGTKEVADLTAKAQESAKETEESFNRWYNGLNKVNQFLVSNIDAIKRFAGSISSGLVDTISEAFTLRAEAKQELVDATEKLRALRASGEASASEIQNVQDRIIELNQTIQENDFFSAIGQSIKKLVIEIGKAIAKALIFAGLLTLIGTIFPVFGASIGVGTKGNFLKLFREGLPFANGGLVYGPVNALIGEGQGTNRRNPEVVAPLDKLKGILAESGGGNMVLTSRLSGSDLLLSVERAKRNRDR
jgi:tape measure domain-containing protein